MSSPISISGTSAAVLRLRRQITHIGPHFRMLLLRGERGSGRHTIARELHRLGPGPLAPFLTHSFADSPPTAPWDTSLLLRSHRGTLFLHQVEQMPARAQSAFLHALLQRDAESVGSAERRRANARIIAATSADLRSLANLGSFDADLFLRLSAVEIVLPPLRERTDDIAPITQQLLHRLSPSLMLLPETLRILQAHPWPGNITQLHDTLRHAAARSNEEGEEGIAPHHLPGTLTVTEPAPQKAPVIFPRLDAIMRAHVLAVLESCQGNKLRAAALLGISRSTLYRMLQ